MTSHLLVRSQPATRNKRRGAGEIAGGGAAECAAVCCCCPCTVLNFVVLAVYTVPVGLFRKAVRRRRRRLLKESAKKNDVGLLQPQRPSSVVGNDLMVDPMPLEEHLGKDRAGDEKLEAVELEKEMWARFAETGFWRSESQRQP